MENNFTFTGTFNAAAVAVVLSVGVILALIANGILLLITITQRKSWKQSSTIFLTSLILSQILSNALFFTFTIIALAAGGWIFGSTDEEKRGTCDFAAYIYWFTNSVILMTLAAISFDRFLFIVKPHLHKRFMRPWVALTLIIGIWLFSAVLSCLPFVGVGVYSYNEKLGTCSIVGTDIAAFVVHILFTLFLSGVIIVTSLWTYCFTRSFFKEYSVIGGDSVYASKKKRLFGIFGSMVIIYGINFTIGALAFIFRLIVFIPYEYYITSTVCFQFVTVANPVIQAYFRPEVKNFLLSKCPFLFTCVCCSCMHAIC